MNKIENVKRKIIYEEFSNPNFDWNKTLFYKKYIFSEEFLEEFKDKLNWDKVSEYQNFSENLLDKYKEKLNWKLVLENQKLSKEIINKFKEYI